MQEEIVSSSGVSRDVRSKKTVHSAFSLPATASPISQIALWDGFGEAVVAASLRGEHCTQDIHSKTFFFFMGWIWEEGVAGKSNPAFIYGVF